MIQDMQKMSIVNEKLLIAQMSLLMGDDCNTHMAVEYCKNKLKDAHKYQIKAEKVSFLVFICNRIEVPVHHCRDYHILVC